MSVVRFRSAKVVFVSRFTGICRSRLEEEISPLAVRQHKTAAERPSLAAADR
jgi:hypothetical protein